MKQIARIPNPGGPKSPGRERWLRISGDDVNGYSLTAHDEPNGPVLYDYWFASLDEVLDAGEDFEIGRNDWTDE